MPPEGSCQCSFPPFIRAVDHRPDRRCSDVRAEGGAEWPATGPENRANLYGLRVRFLHLPPVSARADRDQKCPQGVPPNQDIVQPGPDIWFNSPSMTAAACEAAACRGLGVSRECRTKQLTSGPPRTHSTGETDARKDRSSDTAHLARLLPLRSKPMRLQNMGYEPKVSLMVETYAEYPVSVAERRVLRDLDAGKKIDAVVVTYREIADDGAHNTHFTMASPDCLTGLGLLARVSHMINDAD